MSEVDTSGLTLVGNTLLIDSEDADTVLVDIKEGEVHIAVHWDLQTATELALAIHRAVRHCRQKEWSQIDTEILG